MQFLQTATSSCGGLHASILSDFDITVVKVEMRVLGLIGKLLSGPRMTKEQVGEQVSYVDGIGIVKVVIKVVKDYLAKPASVLTTKIDFFGNVLAAADTNLLKLLFVIMIKAYLTSVITLLE